MICGDTPTYGWVYGCVDGSVILLTFSDLTSYLNHLSLLQGYFCYFCCTFRAMWSYSILDHRGTHRFVIMTQLWLTAGAHGEVITH